MMIMTSRHEAHSMAMNEALALGIPLVMTDTVGFPAAAHAGAALQVAADPAAIAVAIGRLLDDDLLATRLKESGLDFVHNVLAWPRVAEKMIAFYESVITNRSVENG
jgi:glycosyltransferase involved in cell wall biosynthesis